MRVSFGRTWSYWTPLGLFAVRTRASFSRICTESANAGGMPSASTCAARSGSGTWGTCRDRPSTPSSQAKPACPRRDQARALGGRSSYTDSSSKHSQASWPLTLFPPAARAPCPRWSLTLVTFGGPPRSDLHRPAHLVQAAPGPRRAEADVEPACDHRGHPGRHPPLVLHPIMSGRPLLQLRRQPGPLLRLHPQRTPGRPAGPQSHITLPPSGMPGIARLAGDSRKLQPRHHAACQTE